MKQLWEKLKSTRSFEEFYFFAIALILAFGIIQTTGTVLATEKPVVSVVSCSMYPQLHVGDILLVKGTDYSRIQEGDVIVYSTPEMNIPVVHRVLGKNESFLETRGDNNPGQLEFEKKVESEQIHGKILFRIPRIGALKLLAMDMLGLNQNGSDRPLVIDSYPECRIKVPLEQRP